jgi:hypothetical protein
MCAWDTETEEGPRINLECTRYPLAVIRSTWNYHLHPELFLAWLAQVRRGRAKAKVGSD